MPRNTLIRSLFLVPLILMSAAGGLTAQGGMVLVRVTAATGPLAGAEVELTQTGAVAASGISDLDGRVRLMGMAAGSYEIRVRAVGYRPARIRDVEVVPGEIRVVQVPLEAAPFDLEGISVRADRIQIERENTEFSTIFDESAIAMLPVTAQAADLVALTPGARAGHVWGGANFQANSYRVDGLSANHPGLGGGLIEPSINWIDRVEVRGLGSGAEHGGFQGGQVDIVTKRGTNEFSAKLRASLENAALSGSNLVSTETGTEVAERYDIEGEIAGAIVRDRLFYFLAGQRIEADARALNHLRTVDGRYAPIREEQSEDKWFGKLTWSPRPADQLELSGGFLNVRADNFGLTGYEGAGASTYYRAPTSFATLVWRHTPSSRATLEARLNRFARDERSDAYQGHDTPGIRGFALTPPYAAFGNAPFSLRSAPSGASATITATARFRTGELEHLLKIGGEYTRGGFRDRRIRNGGMTWMPALSATFDPADPATWSSREPRIVPTQWGGEVDLDADVANTAGFAQAALALGPRIVLNPGVRWGRWQGWMNPRAGERFLAVEDQAMDPRVGAVVELTGDGALVLKGHWGRYHQDMIAQMFDRAGGSDVFSDEEIWYYRGGEFADPFNRFSEAERDRLAEQGLFTRESVVVLNETGPVFDYKQPYVDQWLVAIEKQFGNSVKLEALYTRRTNRDMIALVDRNRATNYTRYERVRVLDQTGHPLPFEGGTVVLEEVFIPNWILIERLKFCVDNMDVCRGLPPFLEFADTLTLTWDPDYVLTTAPDARREFGQFQLTAKVARPRWGGSFSVALSRLEGNLDNVSGYADPDQFGAGPYVRVNEAVNSWGLLPNFSKREAKVSVWGILPWELRAGLFWTYRSGDHFSPMFRLSGLGFYRYRIGTGATGPDGKPVLAGQELDWHFFPPLEGHNVFVGPRGLPHHQRRANTDLRLERIFRGRGFDVGVALDLFNAFGSDAVTRVNPMVNNGRDYGFPPPPGGPGSIGGRYVPPNQFYRAVLERVTPRVLRIGLAAYL